MLAPSGLTRKSSFVTWSAALVGALILFSGLCHAAADDAKERRAQEMVQAKMLEGVCNDVLAPKPPSDATAETPKEALAPKELADARRKQVIVDESLIVDAVAEGTGNSDAAKKAEARLTALTIPQQAASSNSTLQAFPKFNASMANNSQLATTHFVKAFLPVGLRGCADFKEQARADKVRQADPDVNSHWYNDIGFDISSSVPISSASLPDYAKQELLTRDGALLNLYASFSGRNYTNEAYSWGDRLANVDRLYWIDALDHRQPATAKQALAFFSQGLGIRALKTKLEGTGDLGALATLYGGIGFDGPLFSSEAKEGTPDGMVSLELYVSANVANRNAMRTLLNNPDAPGGYETFGANLTMFVTDRIGIQLQYSGAFGHAADHSIGHVAMLTIGYNKPTGDGAH
jgi:hypothetical protein